MSLRNKSVLQKRLVKPEDKPFRAKYECKRVQGINGNIYTLNAYIKGNINGNINNWVMCELKLKAHNINNKKWNNDII